MTQKPLRLLFISQKIDPNCPTTGFIADWVNSSKKYFSSVLSFSLRGVECGINNQIFISKNRLFTLLKLNYLFWKKRNEFDVVFCHMSGHYVCAIAILAKILGKKITLWYSHPHLDFWAKLSVKIVDLIFTVSPDSFNMEIAKKRVMGHGISSYFFNQKKPFFNQKNVISIGRITKIKNYEILIQALPLVLKKYPDFLIFLYGPIVTQDDLKYKDQLIILAKQLGVEKSLSFMGELRHQEVPNTLLGASIFINLQTSGGIGKATLEAFALGVPTLFCTNAYQNALSEEVLKCLHFKQNENDLASKIINLLSLPKKDLEVISHELSSYVQMNHSLDQLWKKIHGEILSLSDHVSHELEIKQV